jgi:hypothetical protein
MTKKKKGPPPITVEIFLTGSVARIGIYAVFYLKSFAVVHGFIK